MKAFALNIGLFPCPQPWLLPMPHPAPDSPDPTLRLFTSPHVCPSVASLGTKLTGTRGGGWAGGRAALVEWALCWVVGMCGDLCSLSGGQGAAVFVLTLDALLWSSGAAYVGLRRKSDIHPGSQGRSRLENQRQGQERRARCRGYLSLFGLWSPSAGRQLDKEGWEEKGQHWTVHAMGQDSGSTEGDSVAIQPGACWDLQWVGSPVLSCLPGQMPAACRWETKMKGGRGGHSYMMMDTMTENVPHPNIHQRPVSLNISSAG